jgi:signal transduction histidine kinase
VTTPVTVAGQVWGEISAQTSLDPIVQAEAEHYLHSLAELVATTIEHARARAELVSLAHEQKAMRRLATLVARERTLEEIFAAGTEEVALLNGADLASISRIDNADTITMLASWSRSGEPLAVGRQWGLGGENVSTAVAATARPSRIDDYRTASGPLGELARDLDVRSAVAVPVIVRGSMWGVMTACSIGAEPLPLDAETRMVDVAEMLSRAVANSHGRSELAASRARIVAAADDARRRIERNLHDGAQQRLVSLALQLRTTQAELPPELTDVHEALTRLARGLVAVQEELREIARGIHPAILAEGGLGPALKMLARRSALPVELDVQPHPRLPEPVEVAVYYVVSEALTNAARHGHASVVRLELEVKDDRLRLSVRDDGDGGADPSQGSGLVGLRDRVEALAGRIEIDSPPGHGTTLHVTLPVATD